MAFLFVIFVLSAYIKLCESDQNCYKSDPFNQKWKIQWQDNFNKSKTNGNLSLMWKIKHDTSAPCIDNDEIQLSCSVKENAFQSNGYFNLIAKEVRYLENSYTGVTIKSIMNFPLKRIEIRARQPAGKGIQSRIYLQSTNNANKSDILVDIAHFTRESGFKRGIRVKSGYKGKELFNSGNKQNMDAFHVYGAQLNAASGEIRFFFDNLYSERSFKIDELSSAEKFELVIQIKVGGKKIGIENDLDGLTNNNWPRPVFIIDFVKLYQPIETAEAKNMSICFEPNLNDKFEISLTDKIWKNDDEQLFTNSRDLFGVGFLFVIFLILIGYILIQINAVKRDTEKVSENIMVRFSAKNSMALIEHYYDQIDESEIIDELTINEKEHADLGQQFDNAKLFQNKYDPMAKQQNQLLNNDYQNVN